MADQERKLTRKEIRDKIFTQASKPKSKIIEFFGTEIELRQPSMGMIMEAQQNENRADAAALMIVRYAYVPETDERLFDEADLAQIKKWPFGGDLQRVNRAINELTDIDLELEKGNSEETQDSDKSTS